MKGKTMDYICAAFSDKGNIKQTNEDSVLLRKAHTEHGEITMAMVCDGVGGFAKGELASGTTINYYNDWFEKNLPLLLRNFKWKDAAKQWEESMDTLNRAIIQYGNDKNMSLGTTAVMGLFYDDKVLMLNVGDSRLYEVDDQLIQLSKDQSVVQREVDMGHIKPEEMETDSRRNVLLQCVGATRRLIPEIRILPCQKNKTYFLCSDGFRHKLTSEEITAALAPVNMTSANNMTSILNSLVDIVKKRGERDNISVVAIKTIEENGHG